MDDPKQLTFDQLLPVWCVKKMSLFWDPKQIMKFILLQLCECYGLTKYFQEGFVTFINFLPVMICWERKRDHLLLVQYFSNMTNCIFLQTFRLLIIFFLLWCGGEVKGGGNGPICVCHTWGISSGGKFQISEKSSNFPENLKHRAFQRTTKWGSLKKILWIVQSLKEQKI